MRVLVVVFLLFPALVRSQDCDSKFTGRPELVTLRATLAADAFADAFDVYLRDMDDAIAKADDLFQRAQAFDRDLCKPAQAADLAYKKAEAEHNAGECGARTAPPEVVERCVNRRNALLEQHRQADALGKRAMARHAELSGEAERLQPLLNRATLNAHNLLNPDNTEQVFRLYLFYRVELDKSHRSRDRNSCMAFADIATALGKRVVNQSLFIEYLVRNVVERRADVNFPLFAGSPPLEPVVQWGREFGRPVQAFNAKGFKTMFYDNIAENQVRHVAGYMLAGYKYVGGAAELASVLFDKLKGEHADFLLAVEGAEMGWFLQKGRISAASFGSEIASRLGA